MAAWRCRAAAEGRCLNPESFFYPATYVINNMSFWTGARCALVNQAGRFYTHRKLFVNDSGNVLTVDLPIPLSHARINATIHTMSGGASMLGDDIRSIAEERLALIKATLPRPLAVATPVDLFSSPAPDDVHVVNFEGVHIAKDGRDNSLVLYIPFDFKDGVAERDIVFGGLKEILDMSKLELA